jgi:hypothetical protein
LGLNLTAAATTYCRSPSLWINGAVQGGKDARGGKRQRPASPHIRAPSAQAPLTVATMVQGKSDAHGRRSLCSPSMRAANCRGGPLRWLMPSMKKREGGGGGGVSGEHEGAVGAGTIRDELLTTSRMCGHTCIARGLRHWSLRAPDRLRRGTCLHEEVGQTMPGTAAAGVGNSTSPPRHVR